MNREVNDKLKPERTSLSYADFDHEITKVEEDNSLKPHGNQQTKATYRRASEEDELVRYMSNLPGYLEKGEKIPEKVLNVGVLDWASLQQWQYSHKHGPLSSRSSTCISNKSTSISTEGLSGSSSKGLSSPSHQRIFRSLQSHFMASPMNNYSLSVTSSGGSFGNCQNLSGGSSYIDTHSKYARVGDNLSQNHPTSIPKVCDSIQLNPHTNKENDILPHGRMYEAASHTKLEMIAQNDVLGKKVENFRRPNTATGEQVMLGKSKPIVLILPRDIPQNNHCELPDMPTSLGEKLASPTQTRFSEKPKESPCRYPNSDISYSRPLPDEISRSHSQPNRTGSSSIDPEGIKIPTSTSSAPIPVRIEISPCRSRKHEDKKHITPSSSANGSLKGLDQKVTTEKSRSSSPFRRFSFSIGFTGKGSGCKEVAHVPHQSSMAALKCNSENVRGYASSKNSVRDKAGNAAKSRSSSPLRRLLDPLLKPKTANCHRPTESSQKDSALTNKNCRAGNGKCSIEKKELDRDQWVGCTKINAVDLSKNKKYVPSTFQALLRIAVKNGQPLFTFAVDNNSNILAATVKNLVVSKTDECSRIYTFFTFREGKKKNGSWMNQANKSKGLEYIHNVVAQMKVSDSHHYDSNSQNSVDSFSTKEFVLFSVKLKQGNAQVIDCEPNDELAAIVVKSPKGIDFINYALQSRCQNDNQDLHVTVVLPTGVHSLPSDGGPSSLIERWRTGGSCDCGGWDMACRLKILANESQACRKSRMSKACLPYPFELFLQENEQDQENQPAFNFSTFKPGVYSVSFDSSFSLLQAFSICTALVDGLISYELSGSRNYAEENNSRETLLVPTNELKAFDKFDDIPASYVAYPPLSPVGRV